MNSFTLISLIVIIVSTVNAEDSLSSLYSRRIPSQSSEYHARNVHSQFIPNQQEQAQAQQLRSAQFVPTAQQQQQQQQSIDTRKIDLIVRRYADQATQLVSHWARAMKERMIDQAAADAQSSSFATTGQQHSGSHIH